MNLINLTPAQLRQAANLKEQIERLQRKLMAFSQNGNGIPSPFKAPQSSPKSKSKISAAGIARIKAAQKARWAKIKSSAKTGVKTEKKERRKMSAAAKAKLSAMAKARWAKIKAAKK
jgi:hypothetical protein